MGLHRDRHQHQPPSRNHPPSTGDDRAMRRSVIHLVIQAVIHSIPAAGVYLSGLRLRRRSRHWLYALLAIGLCWVIGLSRGAIAVAVSATPEHAAISATDLRLQGHNRQALAVVLQGLGVPDARTRNLRREDFPVLTLMALGLDQPQDFDTLDRDTFNQRLQAASVVTLSLDRYQQLQELADIFQAIGERDLVKPLLDYLLTASPQTSDRLLAIHERLGQFYLSQAQWYSNYRQGDFSAASYASAREEYGKALTLAEDDRLAIARLQLASVRTDLSELRHQAQALATEAPSAALDFDAQLTVIGQRLHPLYRDVIDTGTTPNAIAIQLELAAQLACLQSFATPPSLGVPVSPTVRHCLAPHRSTPHPIAAPLQRDRRALLDYVLDTLADSDPGFPAIKGSRQTQDDLPATIAERLWAEALLLSGEVAESEGRTSAHVDQGLRQTRQGIMRAHRVGATDLSVQLLWQAGRLASQSGDRITARHDYAEAIAELEQLRIDLGSLDADWRYDFRDAIAPLYRDYLALLLPAPEASFLGNNSDGSSLAVSSEPKDLKEAITILQRLQLAELDDFFGEACAIPQQFSLEDLEDSSQDEYHQAALLATVVLDDRTEIILATPTLNADGTRQWSRYSSHYSRQQVAIELSQIRELLQDPSPSSNVMLESSIPVVYNHFFRDVIDTLKQSIPIDTILFLPDASFRSIPLGMLRPDNGHYLIQDYSIAVIPSFDLVATDPESQSRSRLRTLAVGRTIFENETATNLPNTTVSTTGSDRSFRNFSLPEVLQDRKDLTFSNLASVKPEILGIANLLPQSNYLLDADFLSDRFAETITSRRYDVAHIATHGSFGSLAEETFIVAQDGLITFDHLGQILRSNDPTRQTDLDLVILSACQTAAGSDRAVLGMAGMGLRAGVRSTIGSLWNVNDLSTSLIMQAFHHHRLEGLSKADALAAAQRDAIRGDLTDYSTGTKVDRRFESPHYWSPFVLVGDW